MTNQERLQLVRERLAPCQLALRQLSKHVAEGSFSKALPWLEELAEAFLSLAVAAGAPVTPASFE